ncbi:signal peptide protein [Paenibacillus tarimensis]
MNHYRRHGSGGGNDSARLLSLFIGGLAFLFIIGIFVYLTSANNGMRSSTIMSSSVSWNDTSSTPAQTVEPASAIPWDYRIIEGTVGDLIGSDMTILPDNELLVNDDNYATGDKVWLLQYMKAEMTTNLEGRNTVSLSAWKSIKSYKTKEAADQDIEKLKLQLQTEVDLVGVYKTEYDGQTRQFAVITLPSGHQIKQPIDAERYEALKPLKKANVLIEEVHDYEDYDMAYAKFRGWSL